MEKVPKGTYTKELKEEAAKMVTEEDVKFLVEMCGSPFPSSLVILSHAAV